MGKIAIEGVSRSFGSVQAVRDVTLDIGEGEFFTLLGPSGCGKTTLLRMIAGFTELDAGRIRVGADRIDTLAPHRRNIGMVFQNYAIFPNLTVAGNVAYGLKARKVPAGEIVERVAEALALVQLPNYGGRWPHQLSGGQLQRVALARALVIRPQILLLDEPLSNLDARLRIDMRGEIRDLQKGLGIAAVYVTHDQEEALAMSDRIAVMQAGRIVQIGRPEDIYHKPATRFVAEFMGITNMLPGTYTGAGRVRVGATEFVVDGIAARDGEQLELCLRPEALLFVPLESAVPPGYVLIEATVTRTEFLGALTRLDVQLADGRLLKTALLGPGPALPGRRIALAYEPSRIAVLRRPVAE
ncbi:MAG: ABC transporter ATP-binding protein [Hyphomicrobiaceae bacterium]